MLIKYLLNGKTIDLTSDIIKIQSDNFSVDETGKVKATAGEIGGFTTTANEFNSNIYSEYDFTEEDLTKIKNYIQGTGTLTPEEINLYDIYKDGIIDARDYMKISQYIATGITKNTPGKVTLTNGDVFNTFTIKDGLNNDLINLNALESYIKTLDVSKLSINGKNISENRILWQGASFMHETQSANLSEPVSEQKTGIVLVWSGYANGQVQQHNFTYCFVPKEHIEYANGMGIDMHMSGTAFANMCCKYVYVSDNEITGHESNDNAGTANGITYANNRFVLRYVLGV